MACTRNNSIFASVKYSWNNRNTITTCKNKRNYDASSCSKCGKHIPLKYWIKYYSINIVTEKDLKRNDEEFQPQNGADKEVPSKKTTISFVETIFSDKYEAERQKIMNARFSEEDKQRMLQELEEEYRNNSFGNNSGRSIR